MCNSLNSILVWCDYCLQFAHFLTWLAHCQGRLIHRELEAVVYDLGRFLFGSEIKFGRSISICPKQLQSHKFETQYLFRMDYADKHLRSNFRVVFRELEVNAWNKLIQYRRRLLLSKAIFTQFGSLRRYTLLIFFNLEYIHV